MASLDATLETYDSVVELRPLGSAMSVDSTGQPTHPPGAFYVLIDEAVTEVDEGGVAYTAYGFLCMWRGRQTGGYRRFQEFRSLASELSSEHRLPGIRFPLWPFPPSSWRMSPAVIETRARGIEGYLASALKESAERGTLPLPLSKFLGLPAEEEEEEELAAAPMQAVGSGFSAAGRTSAATEDYDGEEGEGGVLLTLQRMRRHTTALRMLKRHLQRAERRETAEEEAPYEDLEPSSKLADELGAPLDRLETLLDTLTTRHRLADSLAAAAEQPDPEQLGEADEPTWTVRPARSDAPASGRASPGSVAADPSLAQRVLARLGMTTPPLEPTVRKMRLVQTTSGTSLS